MSVYHPAPDTHTSCKPRQEPQQFFIQMIFNKKSTKKDFKDQSASMIKTQLVQKAITNTTLFISCWESYLFISTVRGWLLKADD